MSDQLRDLIRARIGDEALTAAALTDDEIHALKAQAEQRAAPLLDPADWANAPIYRSPLRDADGKELFVTIFLEGQIKRPFNGADREKQTPVPFVEPKTDLPSDARERLKAMDDEKLDDLIEWFDGSPHFTDLVGYARAVIQSRVPLERRIVCARCESIYPHWTKNDDQWANAEKLVGGWQEVEFRESRMTRYGESESDWKQLCPKCPPTPEEVAEAKELAEETRRAMEEYKAKKGGKGKTDE